MLATVITSITIYIYSFELKILLFEKFNLHPFDRTNQDHQQKDYDVYLMYCDADFNLAVHTLLPGLERLGYRVFVPERDMELGAVTAEARANALTRSHRAVVLVSQSFIDSQSSMTEFFHAYEHENSATRKRFLVLIKLSEKINYKNYDIFKKYFSTNFFVSVTSKKFWYNLRYWLPAVREQLPDITSCLDEEDENHNHQVQDTADDGRANLLENSG